MRIVPAALTAIVVAAAAALLPLGGAVAASATPSANVAWLTAAADADVDRAFAAARADGRPLLLYWGATWCPPCNQLKATLFNRQDFAALSKGFVAVHVDGDRPGAQKLGRRFQVSGYPTMVLFSPAGVEITRLPGEVEPAQVIEVLQDGLAGGRPAKAVLADALAGRPLPAAEWRLLAFYAWATDEQRLVPKAGTAALLVRLAGAAPSGDAETATRLWLKALLASDGQQGVRPDDALRDRVRAVLADPARARAQFDSLTGADAARLLRALAPADGPGRAAWVAAFDAALRRLQADATLSRADRLGALSGRIEIARAAPPVDEMASRPAAPAPVPPALLAELREQVARADREIADGHERQAVITEAASLLGRAGLWTESDALLEGNLAKSHSPYYLMSQLGGNAQRQGRRDEALDWFRRAWEASVGPATRLQWGAGYLARLVELAPGDAARIEQTASALLADAARDAGSFDGHSLRSLQRAGRQLAGWSGDGRHAAAMRRLQSQLDGVCARVDAADGQRAACAAILKPEPAKSARRATAEAAA